MAEAKNVFLKSKMNKDLDDRLIPPGEYRDAQNVAISRSEDANVGALENVLGNVIKTDFGLESECNVEIIGRYMDMVNDRIFVMMTNFTDNSVTKLDHRHGTGAGAMIGIGNLFSAICVYHIKDETYQILVGGKGSNGDFLNFSKTHPIHHINLMENLLFWTDNRNQPRKINVDSAIANDSSSLNPYYTKEDNISVAKYYPFNPMDLISDGITTMKDVASEFLPDGSENPYYNFDWPGDPNFLTDKFLRFSYRFKFEDGEYSLMAPFTQSTFIPEQDGYFTGIIDTVTPANNYMDESIAFQSTEVRFFKNKVNDIELLIEAPLGITFDNLYEELKVTEIEILYKESDGLSIKVVDTLPREVFEYITPASSNTLNNTSTLTYKYQSRKPYKTLPEKDTIRVHDKIPVRAATQEIAGNRIIYGNFINKHTPPDNIDYNVDADEKLDPIIFPYSGSDSSIEYPNHTLKQNRTYQVGIVLSDRYGRQSTVILSSVDDGQTLSNQLFSGSTMFHPYSDLTDEIIDPAGPYPNYSWPGDSLQILFNNVITSNAPSTLYNHHTGEAGLYNEITNPLGWYSYKVVVKQQEQDYYNIYFPGVLNGGVTDEVEDAADLANPFAHVTLFGDNINKVPRDLKNVGPDQKIFRTSRPRKVENPLWYSVIVNKETGEEGEAEFEDWGSLEARNFILQRNVELGLTEPDQNPNASIEMYLRVDNDSSTITGHENTQHYPGRKADTVISIGTGIDMGLWEIATFPSYIFNPQSNPLIARLEVRDASVGVPSGTKVPILAIYETEPEISRLKLFWETSTSGLISELNTAIEDSFEFVVSGVNDGSNGGAVYSTDFWFENKNPWPYWAPTFVQDRMWCAISTVFEVVNSSGTVLDPVQMQLHSVTRDNSSGGLSYVNGVFDLDMWWDGGGIPADEYPNNPPPIADQYQAFIYIKDPLWFSKNDYHDTFTFNIKVISGGVSQIISIPNNKLKNVRPFGGWQPDPSIPDINGNNLNIPISGYIYSDPDLMVDGTEIPSSSHPQFGTPSDWEDDGYPKLGLGNTINTSPTINNLILDTALENYIADDITWIKLPVANGSWIDGRKTSPPGIDPNDWIVDNYPRISNELNIRIKSQELIRPNTTNTPNFPLEQYSKWNGTDVNHFSISDYTDSSDNYYPYAVLKSDFSNTLPGDYIDGDIFKVVVQWTDCWDPTTWDPVTETGGVTTNSLTQEKVFYCKLRIYLYANNPIPSRSVELQERSGDDALYGNVSKTFQQISFGNEISDWSNEYDNGVWTVSTTKPWDVETRLRFQLGVNTNDIGGYYNNTWAKINAALIGEIRIYKIPAGNISIIPTGSTGNFNLTNPFDAIPGASIIGSNPFLIQYNQNQNSYGNDIQPHNIINSMGNGTIWVGDTDGGYSVTHQTIFGNLGATTTYHTGFSYTWDGDSNDPPHPNDNLHSNSNENEYLTGGGTWYPTDNSNSENYINNSLFTVNTSGDYQNEYIINLNNISLTQGDRVFVVMCANWLTYDPNAESFQNFPQNATGKSLYQWTGSNYKSMGSTAKVAFISGSFLAKTVI